MALAWVVRGLCVAAFLYPAAASASWPSSIMGTWSGVDDAAFPFVLDVTFQGRSGACPPIIGTLGGTDLIEGFYCPRSGHLSFLRHCAHGVVIQVYDGEVTSQAAIMEMSGTFDVVSGCGGVAGEYTFSGFHRG